MSDIDALEGLTPETPEPAKRRIGAGTIVLLAGVVTFIIVIGLALVRAQQTQPLSGAAPDFSITTFDGQPLALSDLRGKTVVLNFWASWCGPCRDEAPALEAVWRDYQNQDVVVLGVTYIDNPDDSVAFMNQYGLTYPSGPDIGTVITKELYHITGVPETFIIDRDGNIRDYIYAGVNEARLRATLDALLAETGSAPA